MNSTTWNNCLKKKGKNRKESKLSKKKRVRV